MLLHARSGLLQYRHIGYFYFFLLRAMFPISILLVLNAEYVWELYRRRNPAWIMANKLRRRM